jgi:hypothetical protein
VSSGRADIICPAQKKTVPNISLWKDTVAGQIADLSENIFSAFMSKCLNLYFYSVAMNESTDARDTVQLAIIIHGIDENFKIMEELAALVPFKGTRKATDLFTTLQNTFQTCQLKINNMPALTTDSTPAMSGNKYGVVAMIKTDAEESRNNGTMMFHCIVLQENLCAKSFPGSACDECCYQGCKFYLVQRPQPQQFQKLLSELGAQCGDLVYYSKVQWLSCSNMLKRFFFFFSKEVQDFPESKEKSVHQFQDPQCDFGFLVDITGHSNELSCHLQGKGQLTHTLYGSIKGFQLKLALWKCQLKANNYSLFPTLVEVNGSGGA